VGCALGTSVGVDEGAVLGAVEGAWVGAGDVVGACEGAFDGDSVGATVGIDDGEGDGAGDSVGDAVGLSVGMGVIVGLAVGTSDGEGDGAGDSVGSDVGVACSGVVWFCARVWVVPPGTVVTTGVGDVGLPTDGLRIAGVGAEGPGGVEAVLPVWTRRCACASPGSRKKSGRRRCHSVVVPRKSNASPKLHRNNCTDFIVLLYRQDKTRLVCRSKERRLQ
jgi:hypothetical protein